MASTNPEQGAAALQALNSKTLGAQFPEITLPDGSKVQTGTVGALLKNIERYNNLQQQQHDADADAAMTEQELAGLEAAFSSSLPMLFKVGFFNLFTPEEWVAGHSNPGRKKVGELAMEWIEAKK